MTVTGRFLAYLDRQSRIFLWLAVVIMILGLGIIDYETGPLLSISIFYVIPVALASWALGRSEGLLVTFICAAIWNGLRFPADQHIAPPAVYVWNAAARLGLLVIISLLLSETRVLLRNESRASHTDFLTGILNRRALTEAASTELERLARTGRPFTLLYMDLDNFKQINDTSGHEAGDRLLICVATVLRLQLRGIDQVARLGGDEFAAILPDTDEQAAHRVAPRLCNSLLEEMQKQDWPITFSIGTLTCLAAVPQAEEVFRAADQLMYAAKKEGKNTIHYHVYSQRVE